MQPKINEKSNFIFNQEKGVWLRCHFIGTKWMAWAPLAIYGWINSVPPSTDTIEVAKELIKSLLIFWKFNVNCLSKDYILNYSKNIFLNKFPKHPDAELYKINFLVKYMVVVCCLSHATIYRANYEIIITLILIKTIPTADIALA